MDRKGIPVTVHLSTEHSMEDGSTERQQLTSEGSIWLHREQWVIRFAEQQSGRSHVMTTMKVRADQLTVIRHGDVAMRHVFDPSKRTKGLFKQTYGTMEMVTTTERLHRRELQHGWQVEWRYRLTLNGVETGMFHMNLTIKRAKME